MTVRNRFRRSDLQPARLDGGTRPVPPGLIMTILMIMMALALPVAAFGQAWSRHRSLADKLRQGPGVANHPVGVVPSGAVTVPPDWPLDADGSITCTTCHATLPSLDGRSGSMLRRITDPSGDRLAFCATCHTDDSSRSAAAMHWTVVGVAHVRPESDALRAPTGLLDAQSRQCLSCHDGVNAGESVNGPGGRGHAPLIGQGGEHPVGVIYRGGRADRGRRLRAASRLPRTVRLPNGRLSCVSCHDLYARDRHRLTVPIEGSALCFTCHDMD